MSTKIDYKKTVLQFYERFIEDYLVGDLKRLQGIEPDPKTGLYACTIPTAMSVIAGMDLLGFLLDEKGKPDKSGNNIKHLISLKTPHLFSDQYNEAAITKITTDYRQGMMHHFFPKFHGKFVGITKDSSSSSLFVSHYIDGTYQDSLNVSVLLKDFLECIIKLKSFLEKDADEELLQQIVKRLKGLDANIILSLYSTCTTIPPGASQNR